MLQTDRLLLRRLTHEEVDDLLDQATRKRCVTTPWRAATGDGGRSRVAGPGFDLSRGAPLDHEGFGPGLPAGEALEREGAEVERRLAARDEFGHVLADGR